MSQKPRKTQKNLSLKEKREIVDLLTSGAWSQRSLAEKFQVSKTTIAKIQKEKDIIVQSFNDLNSERLKTKDSSKYEMINKKTYAIFSECRAKHIPITG